jgi:hypothetical protein
MCHERRPLKADKRHYFDYTFHFQETASSGFAAAANGNSVALVVDATDAIGI